MVAGEQCQEGRERAAENPGPLARQGADDLQPERVSAWPASAGARPATALPPTLHPNEQRAGTGVLLASTARVSKRKTLKRVHGESGGKVSFIIRVARRVEATPASPRSSGLHSTRTCRLRGSEEDG